MGQHSEMQIQERDLQEDNNYISKSLYQIRQDHYDLMQAVEDNEGELSPEIEQALILTKDDLEAKAVSYGYVIKGYEDREDLIDKEINRLQELKHKAEKKKELFKQRLSEGLRQFGIEKVETPTLKLSFRKSESVEITDPSKVPFDYVEEKVVKTISKTKIKEGFKAGVLVPGAELKTNYNLQIK